MSKKKVTTKVPPAKASSAPATGKLVSASGMDVDLLEQLVKLMGSHDLSTLDVRDGDKRIIIKRGAVQIVSNTPISTGLAASAVSSSPTPATPPAPPTPPAEDTTLVPIKSPMVGTFYAAPTPDSKPFVQVGSAVNEETDVCVIEAMKVFNNIKAETRGTVAKILVNNGQTVEFGQTLFLVKP